MTESPSGRGRFSLPTCLTVSLIVAGLLFLLTGGGLLAYLAFRGAGEDNPGTPLEVRKLTPTPPTSPVAPGAICDTTVVGSGDVQVAIPLPTTLSIGEQSLPIVPVKSSQAGWTYPAGSTGTASWICGTVVNYVVGLEPTTENESLLNGLRPGDQIDLRLSSGTILSFRFAEQRETTPNDATVFQQFVPRLTLIVETGDTTWQVATANFADEIPIDQPQPPATQAQPGQPVRVGDAQIVVLNGHAEENTTGQPPETMYYLVEYSVENVGTTPLDASAFLMQLQDGVGNDYLLSPAASALGDNGLLGDQILAGVKVQGSAGYVVPQNLAGPNLTWTFSPEPGSEVRASVSIPYQGTPTDDGTGTAGVIRADVDITDAFLNSTGTALIIEGQIRNLGDTAFSVELTDVNLSSSAGTGNLRMAAPPLPWTVQPGQSRIIELQYERPNANSALLTLLGFSFEIQGM